MIRIAFTLLGGTGWLGGRHYLVNLLTSLRTYQAHAVTPVLFLDSGIAAAQLTDLTSIAGVEVVRSPHFTRGRRMVRLAQAVFWGLDVAAVRLFRQQGIDVVFEPAQFYGWRLPMPALAWIPDFQDRHLPDMFGRRAHLQKWIGQGIQAATGRTFVLSSEDARADCERFYPATRGNTRVVSFAVPPGPEVSPEQAAAVRAAHGLPREFFFLPNQFWRHKNHVCVVRALGILKSEGLEVTVAATGNTHDLRHGEYFAELQREIAAAGAESNFRLLGVVPYEHVTSLMQATAALINPSRCEGWSTTVEEAKSVGTPLILSDLGVHREQAGNTAQYFSPDSPRELASILARHQVPPRRPELAARARADTFLRLERYASSFVEVARDCLERAGRKAPPQ